MVHTQDFINERKQKLESFLRILAAHESIRLDPLLCKFLTQNSFDDNVSDPLLYRQYKAVRDRLPNVSGLSFDYDSLNTFVSFQFNIGGDAEPEELKP